MKNQNVWFSNAIKTKGYPVYVEQPAIINNVIAKQLKEDKAKYLAIVTKKNNRQSL